MAEPIMLDRGAGYCGDIEPLCIVGVYVGLVRDGIGLLAAQTDLRAVLANCGVGRCVFGRTACR